MAFEHAIVLGGSITGLTAAAALAGEFERVTIVERDELLVDGPAAKESRRGVPQGDQVHHLLALGARRLEELLPGFDADLLAAGCEKHDNLAEFAQYINGGWRARFESELALVCFTRPLFEWVLRSRVLSLANVTVVKSLVSGLIASPDGTAVVGALAKGAPDGQILADLVVDATGRGTKAPNWLQDMGYDRPKESHVRVYMGYTCFRIRVPEGVLPPGVESVACPAASGANGGMVIWPCGNGEHIVVAAGIMGKYPPTAMDELLAHADSLPSPFVAQCIRAGTLLSEPKAYKMPGDQRLRWEDLDRRPEGFVVMGDAVASYNPTYGQGMTMAAVGAVELRRVLRAAGGEINGVADEFQVGLAPHVDMAWDNAVRIDSMYPGAEFENQTPPPAPSPEFSAAFVAVQSEEPEVALAARLAMHWMDNRHIQTESVLKKLNAWITNERQLTPQASDPLNVPPLISV